MALFHNLNDKLTQTLREIKQIHESNFDPDSLEKHNAIICIISSMIDEPDLWEQHCPFNVYHNKTNFTTYIEHCKAGKNYYLNRLDALFHLCINFLIELDLSLSRNGKESSHTDNLYDLINNLRNKAFYSDYSEQSSLNNLARSIYYKMPIEILNFYMGKEGFGVFNNFERKRRELEKAISKHRQEIEDKISEIEKLKVTLDDYKTAFNFVGLSHGFENLLKKKSCAKWWTFTGLTILLIATLIPLSFSFYQFIQNIELSWQKMLPIIGLEFVLIYFFRVVLNHYHSVQTQIMQLELRQSLCQFIQSYAEYAKEIKTSDKDALEKFENLIFSSILSNPDKVPGTFDGIDGLTTLLKELKK